MGGGRKNVRLRDGPDANGRVVSFSGERRESRVLAGVSIIAAGSPR